MKKIITNAISNIPRKGQHNIVKILCLTLGLSISAVIIAEIYYEQTYNQSFPDHKRICRVTEAFSNERTGIHGGKSNSWRCGSVDDEDNSTG